MTESNSKNLNHQTIEPDFNADFEITETLLTRYKGSGSHVIVPSGIKTIGKESFAGKMFLTAIAIPNSVVNIESKAFFGCKNLQNVVLGSGIESIGSFAFADCTSIKSINIPSSLESIGDYAFSYVFGDGGKVRKRDQDPYYAELPKGLKNLGSGAFLGCDGLIAYQNIDTPMETSTEYSAQISNLKPLSDLGRALYDPEKESGHWADSLRFKAHAVFIRSSQTRELLYVVWMPSRDEERKNLHAIMGLWKNPSSFDFQGYDKLFSSMISPDDKIHMAFYRLLYPYLLSEQHRTVYMAFLKKQAVRAMHVIAKDYQSELLKMMEENDMITKENIELIFDTINQTGNTKHVAWIMNYKEKNFSLNAHRLML